MYLHWRQLSDPSARDLDFQQSLQEKIVCALRTTVKTQITSTTYLHWRLLSNPGARDLCLQQRLQEKSFVCTEDDSQNSD